MVGALNETYESFLVAVAGGSISWQGHKSTRHERAVCNSVMALRVQTQISGDVFILLCNGRIVFGDDVLLREKIVNMLPGTPKIVLNLEGVDYIGSKGLGMLVELLVSARNRGGELKLASPHEHIKELFRRTNLDTIFTVYDNSNDAVAAFGKQQVA